MERHPEFFEEAKGYEKNAIDHGSPFTWSEGESLIELSEPSRVAEIQNDYKMRIERMRSKIRTNPLRPGTEPIDVDDVYGRTKVCVACHK